MVCGFQLAKYCTIRLVYLYGTWVSVGKVIWVSVGTVLYDNTDIFVWYVGFSW